MRIVYHTSNNTFQEGEKLVSVPSKALFTILSVPQAFRLNHPTLSVHGVLASYLAFDDEAASTYEPWRATWPSSKDLQESMPIHWPRKCHDALAPGVKSVLLEEQATRFDKDWNFVASAFPEAQKSLYLYHWLIVNTRSFYFELSDRISCDSVNDRMVLCPFADYFNHSDQGVSQKEIFLRSS